MEWRRIAASARRPAIMIRVVCAACFVVVGLSVFLPYYGVADYIPARDTYLTVEYAGIEVAFDKYDKRYEDHDDYFSTIPDLSTPPRFLPRLALLVAFVGLLVTLLPGVDRRDTGLVLTVGGTVAFFSLVLLELFAGDGYPDTSILWGYHLAEALTGAAVILAFAFWWMARRTTAAKTG